MAALWKLVALALSLAAHVMCVEYKHGQKVELYVNKVGPYFNPHETYHFYFLPVCTPEKIEHKSLTLGEVLDGDRMALSLYNVAFKQNVVSEELCQREYSDTDLEILRVAIEDLYYFEFVLDDIPIRGFIGQLEEGDFLPHHHSLYLWTHFHFYILYNANHVIYANVSTKDSEPVLLDGVTGPFQVRFTYSITWIPTNLKYEDRGQMIRDDAFFPKTLEIHWLSVINSIILVFLLLGFIIIIMMRVLKHDFKRYNLEDEEEEEDGEEMGVEDNGWKVIQTDVFRFPQVQTLFCAILGVGSQFLALATGILVMGLLGVFNVHRHGAINSSAIVLYAFTSWISGYVAGHMYKQMGGQNWVWNINLTSFLFAGPFFLVWATVNSVAWAYGATLALPWTTIVLLIALWLFIGYPLTVLGGVLGKNWAGGFNAPCRTKNVAREIPSVPWYRGVLAHCVVGGFLPFSAISVELYYIFSTLWGRDHYTLFGILFIVYVILLSVTASVSVALTFFQLSSEDYRWWWRSLFSAGSTGVFVMLYAVFYYVHRSSMSGVLQSVEFFGFMLLACYVFFLLLGSVSFFASLAFVRYIYLNLKMD
ncbi:transmembrane 9 superfamily member 1-like [Babylonia areolata]|uniref:transmembrane 9 superfamily member 1-like n=1 Tax=Babylonia areolata TaxID=304850 RepID=UPI003FD0FA36